MAAETFIIESSLTTDVAFDLMIDLLRVGEWDRGIRDSRLVEGKPGTIGARYEVTVRGFDGELTTAIYELVAVDAPRSFTMVGTHRDFRADDTVTLEPTRGGCSVTYDAALVLLGDEPPLTEEQLAETFATIVDVPRTGLATFLNP